MPEITYVARLDDKGVVTGVTLINTALSESDKAAKKVETSYKSLAKQYREVGEAAKQSGELLSIGLTAPLLATAIAAFEAAKQFDEAMDAISGATGATGEALESLGNAFRNVFVNVPQSAATVSTAISELSQRLGLTGTALEAMAKQELDLARITGADLKPLIESTTRVFGAWNVATAQQAGTLDFLYRASTQTGISVTALSMSLTQFGPILKQMGFSLEQSTALLAKFDKEGISSDIVIAAMKKGLVTFAKEGEAAPAALQRLISEIKNTGNVAAGNQEAIKVFGARSGPELAQAVREGRLGYEQLLSSLTNGTSTIAGVAASTLSFSDKLALLGHQATAALEPLGVVLIDILEKQALPLFQSAVAEVQSLVQSFKDLSPAEQTLILVGGAAVAAIGPALLILGSFATHISAILKLLPALATMLGVELPAAAGMATTALTLLKAAGAALLASPLFSIAVLAALGVAVYELAKSYVDLKNAQTELISIELREQTAAGQAVAALKAKGIAIDTNGKSLHELESAIAEAGQGEAWFAQKQREVTAAHLAANTASDQGRVLSEKEQKALEHLREETDKYKASVTGVSEQDKAMIDGIDQLIAAAAKSGTEVKTLEAIWMKSGAQVKAYALAQVALGNVLPENVSKLLTLGATLDAQTESQKKMAKAAADDAKREQELANALEELGVHTTDLTDLTEKWNQTVLADITAQRQRATALSAVTQEIEKQQRALSRNGVFAGPQIPIGQLPEGMQRPIPPVPVFVDTGARRSADEETWKKYRAEGKQAIDSIVGDISKMFTDMIGHGKTFWEAFKGLGTAALASIADFGLKTFLKALLQPFEKQLGKLIDSLSKKLTDWADDLGKSLKNVFKNIDLKSLGGFAGLLGIGGSLGGALGGTKGTILGTAAVGAGIIGAGIATGATTGILGVGAAAGPIGLAIAGAAALGVALVTAMGQGRKEADKFVKAFQNPFGQAISDLFSALTEAQRAGTLTTDQVKAAREQVNQLWASFQDAAAKATHGVGQQAIATIAPMLTEWNQWLDAFQQGTEAVDAAAAAQEEATKAAEAAAAAAQVLQDNLNKLTDVESQLADTRQQLSDAFQKKLDLIDTSIGQSNTAIDGWRSQITQINTDISGSARTLNDASYWQKVYSDSIKDSQQELQRLIDLRTSTEGRIASLQDQVHQDQLDQALVRAKQTKDDTAIAAAEAAIQEFQDTLAQKARDSRVLELQQLQQQLPQIIQQQGEAQKAYEAAQRAAQNEVDSQKQELRDFITSKAAERVELLKNIQTEKDRIDVLMKERKDVQDLMDALGIVRKSEKEQIDDTIAALMDRGTQLEAERAALVALTGAAAQTINVFDQLAAVMAGQRAAAAVQAANPVPAAVPIAPPPPSSVETGIVPGFPTNTPSFAVGSDYVPRDMFAKVHQGERIVPAWQNRQNGGNAQTINNYSVSPNFYITEAKDADVIVKKAVKEIDRLMRTGQDGFNKQVRKVVQPQNSRPLINR